MAKYKKPLKTISGRSAEGIIHTFRAESFISIFIVTAFITSLTLAIGIFFKEAEGPIEKLVGIIAKKTNSQVHKNDYFKIFVHFVLMFIFTFIFLYVCYQLFGYGHNDLGPCQKVVKCN